MRESPSSMNLFLSIGIATVFLAVNSLWPRFSFGTIVPDSLFVRRPSPSTSSER